MMSPLPLWAISYALSTGITPKAFIRSPIIGLLTLLAAPMKWIYLGSLETKSTPSMNWLEWLLQMMTGPCSGRFSRPSMSTWLKHSSRLTLNKDLTILYIILLIIFAIYFVLFWGLHSWVIIIILWVGLYL